MAPEPRRCTRFRPSESVNRFAVASQSSQRMAMCRILAIAQAPPVVPMLLLMCDGGGWNAQHHWWQRLCTTFHECDAAGELRVVVDAQRLQRARERHN